MVMDVPDNWAEQAKDLYEKGAHEQAAAIAFSALALAEQNQDQQQQATAHNTIGITYLKRSLYEKAIVHFLQAENLLSALNNPRELLPCLVNIAIVLNAQKRFEEAQHYYQKALDVVGAEGTMQKAQVLNGLGNLLHNTNRHSEALECFLQVKSIAEKYNVAYGVAMGGRNAGACLIELAQYDAAYALAENALHTAKANGFAELGIGAVQAMAEAAFKKGDSDKAAQLLNEYLPDAIQLNDDYNLRYHYWLLYLSCKQLNNTPQALHYHELWSEVDKRMNDAERVKTVNELHIQYETEKKEVALQKALLLQKETELAALKSRMNPHFLFNALAGIQQKLQQHKVDEAISAIENFALLTREVLRHSSMEYVTVQREADMLKAYIELEKLQLDQHFAYSITGADESSFFEIPPLMLQPVIENALKHGLRHKQGKKTLNVSFELLNDDALKVTIDDNGIGREASAILNAKRNGHDSFALASIHERIALLRDKNSMQIEFYIEDKYEYEQPAGTRTVFNFRYITP